MQDVPIVDNIRTFAVSQNSAGPFPPGTVVPNCYTVNLVLNATPVPISRTVKITSRNVTTTF